jgi:hypothetical protein
VRVESSAKDGRFSSEPFAHHIRKEGSGEGSLNLSLTFRAGGLEVFLPANRNTDASEERPRGDIEARFKRNRLLPDDGHLSS